MATPGYPLPKPQPDATTPESLFQHGRELSRAVGLAMQGKINCTQESFTLTANVTTTTLTDARLFATGAVLLMPTTANAAAALGTTYATTRGKGAWVFTHANTATTDRTFVAVIIG